ncbi:uncharacterized protein LOC128555499 isoform X2 [Mercenaria mercenaria]|nr:uncharacterized protein LOC128555499 isoform X2 [Mercenaria mercenaria]
MEDKVVNDKLYKVLLDVVGTEKDIRSRQEIFKYMGMINSFGDRDSISISGGSLSEGFDLKGSDEDIMLVLKNVDVLPIDEKATLDKDTLRVNMQEDELRPGYASLFLSEDQESFVNNEENSRRTEILNIKRSLQKSGGKCIVASARFRGQFIIPGNTSHGPCISDGVFDFAISLHGSLWPRIAKQRVTTCTSKRWLSDKLVNELLTDGCMYVPVGPRHYYSGTLWRMSFAIAEKRLILSMRHIHWLCYGLLKVVFKEGLGKTLTDKDIICSYYLKTCLFWLTEETDNDEKIWNKDNLFTCYMMCLDQLIKWVETCNCPNYMIPDNNMFKGKVHENNKPDILKTLVQLKCSGYKGLYLCESLRPYMETDTSMTAADREAKLDFLCFRVLHVYPFDDMDLLISALERMENEYDKQVQPFAKGVIGTLVSCLHQELAQMIHVSEDEDGAQRKELRRLQKEHLRKGCRSDRLCGLILLASFHCTARNYYTALEILNTVCRKMMPDAGLLLRRNPSYTQEEIRVYTEKFCGRGASLENKFNAACVRKLVLLDNSSIVPEEFQPEVFNYRPLNMISPTVYAYSLKFVCCHHSNDEKKALETLAILDHIIETRFLISSVGAIYSTDCTVVAACYEAQGNYDTARKYYTTALNCDQVCRSTKYRLQRLEKRLVSRLPKHEHYNDA